MKLKEEYRKSIIEEFGFTAKMMKEKQAYDAKLFYFSGTWGAVSRIFNLSFDSELVFIHSVLNAAYNTIMARTTAARAGETSIILPDDYFDKLTDYIEQLADRIKENKSTYDILEKITTLAFASTGNGYYLLKKGVLKI
jgi:hypothetical protein